MCNLPWLLIQARPALSSTRLVMHLLFSWFFFLSLAPRRAFSVFESVAYSLIRQCGPFNVSFFGGELPDALPLTLTIIPFDSTPLAFTIPESAWDNSTNFGSYVTFLPLPAGVSLMASLDDAAGNSATLISDILQVMPSPNTSCISANMTTPAPFQLVGDAVSQCSPFNVSQNTSSLEHTLSVRGFIPMSLSFDLEGTDFHTSQGVDTFTYIMNVASGLRVAFLFDDSQGNRQVSDLLLVGGGVSSPSECLGISAAPSSQSAVAQVGVKGISRSAVYVMPRSARLIYLN